MNWRKKTTVAFARGWNNLSISRSRPKGVVFSCDLRKVYHNTKDLSTILTYPANDSSGNSNNATVNTGTWTTGKYGKGVNVSGSAGSDVSVPDFGY